MSSVASRYSRSSDVVERLVEENLPLVRHVVGRVMRRLPARYEADELIQWGVCGLLHAARTYDPGQGVAFSTFAYRRIHGAILDELRKADTHSRTERQRTREVSDAIRAIESEVERPARPEEVADRTGLPLPRVHELMKKRLSGPVSIDEAKDDPQGGLEVLGTALSTDAASGPEALAELAERKELLAEAIADLPERERHVVVLYYYKDMRIKEIAAALGVTDGRVSQIHTKALTRLAEVIAKREGREP